MGEQNYGILIDNEYCTGCHTCELACKNEHDLPKGQWGVKLLEMGPWQLEDGYHWEYRFVPVLTQTCDLCAERVSKGEFPTACSIALPTLWSTARLTSLRSRCGKKARWRRCSFLKRRRWRIDWCNAGGTMQPLKAGGLYGLPAFILCTGLENLLF